MSQYYEDDEANLTARENFKSKSIGGNDVSIILPKHRRNPSNNNNYSTAKNEMIMEAPNEEDVEKNPYIWSHTVSVGNRSFVDYRQKYQKLAPPPIYLEG